jgi:hypothetical protein
MGKNKKKNAAPSQYPKRAYNAAARQILKAMFGRAIQAVDDGLIQNPGDLGLVANALKHFAINVDDACDVKEWFDDCALGPAGPFVEYLTDGAFAEAPEAN